MVSYVFSVFTENGVETYCNINKEDAIAEVMVHMGKLLERGEILGFFLGVENR